MYYLSNVIQLLGRGGGDRSDKIKIASLKNILVPAPLLIIIGNLRPRYVDSTISSKRHVPNCRLRTSCTWVSLD